jgi:hypothetical protein
MFSIFIWYCHFDKTILSEGIGQNFFAALNKGIDNARFAGCDRFLHNVADLVGMIDPKTQIKRLTNN